MRKYKEEQDQRRHPASGTSFTTARDFTPYAPGFRAPMFARIPQHAADARLVRPDPNGPHQVGPQEARDMIASLSDDPISQPPAAATDVRQPLSRAAAALAKAEAAGAIVANEETREKTEAAGVQNRFGATQQQQKQPALVTPRRAATLMQRKGMPRLGRGGPVQPSGPVAFSADAMLTPRSGREVLDAYLGRTWDGHNNQQ